MGAHKGVSEDEIAGHLAAGLTVMETIRACGLTSAGNGDRIRKIAKQRGLQIAKRYAARQQPDERDSNVRIAEYLQPHGRRHVRCDNGTVIVFSDSHYWPGVVTTAHRAVLHFCRLLKPSIVVNNGDSLDGASISRYARIGWDSRPKLKDELEACTMRLVEIEQAAGTHNLYWNLGNHDGRFETYLASRVPEHEGITGFHLKDHFPAWLPSWSVWINESVVVKHRMKGGINAARNNTIYAGKTVVTGHLHSLQVQPFSDYTGTRWGVDTGCLAQPYGPQFTDYTEDGAVNWRSGFAVLTFRDGLLLQPETVLVRDEDRGIVDFRGELTQV